MIKTIHVGFEVFLITSLLALAHGLAPSSVLAVICIQDGTEVVNPPGQDPDGNNAGTNTVPTKPEGFDSWQRPVPVIPQSITINAGQNRWIYRAHFPVRSGTPQPQAAVMGFINFWTQKAFEGNSPAFQIHFWWKDSDDPSFTFVGGWVFDKSVTDQCWYKTEYPTWPAFVIRDGDEFGVSLKATGIITQSLTIPLPLAVDIW